MWHLRSLLLVSSVLILSASAQHGEVDEAYDPKISEASDEPTQALAAIKVPDGFSLSLWAAEPMLANPVAFCLDAAGRCFVAESFRLHHGVTDMRSHMEWLHDELAANTVEDRVDYMRKHLSEKDFAAYSVDHERIRLLTDTDGDGKADRAQVYADGFKEAAAGIAAGLLVNGNDVYYTCIPDLWRLTDADGDGVAEKRESLHRGYGVKTALLGHDLHGLRVGPDGRLYFSVGDRGMNVQHEGGHIVLTDRGSVLRCELDGSNLEVFASGLRNPQELVFDDHGNLFTGDNNSDGGDQARWVYVVRGGDTGWRHNYQYVTKPNLRGPWNAELGWKPFHEEQPAYITPPIANMINGPSGLTYYPGAIWGPEWDGTFFLAEFRGAVNPSGVQAFRNKPLGAGFEVVEERQFLWSTLVTDVDFGTDGALWTSDWVQGWGMTGKGRIWRLVPDSAPEGVADEVRSLLMAGMDEREGDELAQLCSHAHRDVRQEAHLELARRAAAGGIQSGGVLTDLAMDRDGSMHSRLAGIWGLGAASRWGADLGQDLVLQLLASQGIDPEIRAQALRVLGDLSNEAAVSAATVGLEDESARVRFFAAEALGAFGEPEHAALLFDLLERDGASDAWIRTAAIHALERLGAERGVLSHARNANTSVHVRRALVAVLRRWETEDIRLLLDDPDERVRAEAARAIHDVPIAGRAREALARLLDRGIPEDAYLARRSIAAARELHMGADRARLLTWLGREGLSGESTTEILSYLAEWADPSPVDPVHGAWRPVAPGSVEGLEGQLVRILGASNQAHWGNAQWLAWVRLANSLELGAESELWASVVALVGREDLSSKLRCSAFEALMACGHAAQSELQAYAASSEDNGLRAVGLLALSKQEPARAVALLEGILSSGGVRARQAAVGALARVDSDLVDPVLVRVAVECGSGGQASSLAVELLEAAELRGSADLVRATEPLRTAVSPDDSLAAWRPALTGGFPSEGRALFLERTEAQCLRCHVVGDQGSSEVGPELSDVGSRLSTSELLRSILEPDGVLAEGYENWIFGLDDGTLLVGRILSEDEQLLRVLDAESVVHELDPGEVELRKRDVSAMPVGLVDSLSLRELRDLMAFLEAQVK
ncbi:MAG: quinoprotein glucose dehydrogenase [Planctomycetota bacterium]|jgi:quinoprotein glucose dehydrogenase